MTFAEIILKAIPNASVQDCEWILWERTPYPMGRVTARSLYKAADRVRRAGKSGRQLCELCDRLAVDGWTCERCKRALSTS